LVQWEGLSPEDTSWEPWTELKDTYNLEDKVDFVGGDDVMNPSAADKPTKKDRPKRNIQLPKRLEGHKLY
jgi:hypothetical protein